MSLGFLHLCSALSEGTGTHVRTQAHVTLDGRHSPTLETVEKVDTGVQGESGVWGTPRGRRETSSLCTCATLVVSFGDLRDLSVSGGFRVTVVLFLRPGRAIHPLDYHRLSRYSRGGIYRQPTVSVSKPNKDVVFRLPQRLDKGKIKREEGRCVSPNPGHTHRLDTRRLPMTDTVRPSDATSSVG